MRGLLWLNSGKCWPSFYFILKVLNGLTKISLNSVLPVFSQFLYPVLSFIIFSSLCINL